MNQLSSLGRRCLRAISMAGAVGLILVPLQTVAAQSHRHSYAYRSHSYHSYSRRSYTPHLYAPKRSYIGSYKLRSHRARVYQRPLHYRTHSYSFVRTARMSHPGSSYRFRASGRPRRSAKARYDFMRSTGHRHGWSGHVVDHIVPLACGGSDSPSNMQWQDAAAAKAKDRVERRGCSSR
jgi:hypothetical protein